MKLRTLKPRVLALQPKRLQPKRVERIRGRRLMERNARMFMRNPCCVDCEADGIATPVEEWDHDIPLYAGGKDDESNLVGRCRIHHLVKTKRDQVKYGLGC